MTRELALQQRLGYAFSDPALLRQALRHSSCAQPHNERLEFLGDAVLGAVVAEWLYAVFPEAAEGELTRRRAALVNRDALVWLARQLELGECLELGAGEQRTGGAEKPAILATALEAVLAAVYLDGGWPVVNAIIRQLMAPRLREVQLAKDPKTQVQEWLQARRLPLPVYQLQASGALFTVACLITLHTHQITTQGQGPTRRSAEQQAASLALAQLGLP